MSKSKLRELLHGHFLKAACIISPLHLRYAGSLDTAKQVYTNSIGRKLGEYIANRYAKTYQSDCAYTGQVNTQEIDVEAYREFLSDRAERFDIGNTELAVRVWVFSDEELGELLKAVATSHSNY